MNRTLLITCFIFCLSPVFSQNVIVDSLFGDNGLLFQNFATTEEPTRLLMQPDGKFLVGGFANGGGYDIYTALARFDICGVPDSSFATNGLLLHSFDLRNLPYDIALQSNGRIVCAGVESNSNAGSAHIPFVSRYKTDGSPDTSFSNDGFIAQRFDPVSSGGFYSVKVYPDQRILCIGTSTSNINGGVNGYGAMRFNSNGTLDPTFDGDGIARYSITGISVNAVRGHLLPNGNIIEAFSGYAGGYSSYMCAAGIDSNGAVLTGFGNSGVFIDTTLIGGQTYTALQADQKVVMAALDPSGLSIKVVRISAQGVVDNSFGNGGHVIYTTADPYTLTLMGVNILSDGRILAYGRYINSTFILALNSDGSPDNSFGTNGYMLGNWSPNSVSYTKDILELSNGQWMAATSTSSDYLMVRLIDESNVPHLSYNGWMLSTTGGDSFQWYHNGSIVSGATGNAHDPQQDGDYYVVATDSWGCSYTSDTFNITNSSAGQLYSDLSVSVFPNPFNDYFQIESKEDQISSVVITDLAGRSVISMNVHSSTTKAGASLLPGTYLVQISTAKGVMKRMIVKQ